MPRAAIELAKEWRTDRALRRLESLLVTISRESTLMLSGSGDVIEPSDGIIGIGSGGMFATAAAKALMANTNLSPTVIADLRILRGLHFDKRGVDQVGQATCDLRFADAGGAHENHVARPDFVAQVIGKLPAPPTISYGDGRGPLGRLLADDVLVQRLDNFLWCQFLHGFDKSSGRLPRSRLG